MKKLKNSRFLSFIAVGAVYAVCISAGVLIYSALPFSFWLNLLIADVAATIICFAFSLIFGNASVYDPYWSIQPPVIVIALAIHTSFTALTVILLVPISLWAMRLTANWAYTFADLSHQDWRYTMLKEKTGKLYPLINFVGIHLVPTLIVYACTLPAAFSCVYHSEATAWTYIFAAISVIALTLQGIADVQMHRYRKNRKTPFIRAGLWKHSRHPNYLGEILMWWGVALAAVSAMPGEPYLLAGAALNTLLFLFVSIPMADGRQSTKPGFDEYKKETRMLLPFPRFLKSKS